MTDQQTPAQKAYGDVAPALADYSDKVLFDGVWERPGLSRRDRSLITVASLVALYRTNELPSHVKRALDNGVTREELVELVTHLPSKVLSITGTRRPAGVVVAAVTMCSV
jgi:4-carboxymuconolactone decarboxylase